MLLRGSVDQDRRALETNSRASSIKSRMLQARREFFALLFRHEPAVLRHVADRFLRPAERLADEREVEMRIRHHRVDVERGAIALGRFGLAIAIFEQHAKVVEHKRVGAPLLERLAVDGFGLFQPAAFVQQISTIDFVLDRVLWLWLNHFELAGRGIALERQKVLPGFGLPAARALLHHHAVADRTDAQARERHRDGQVPPQLLEGLVDALRRYSGGCQGLSGAQHDKILKGEEIGLPGTSDGRYEPGPDQAVDGAARKAEE